MQVLVVSQCNMQLPDAVRRMSRLERLVREGRVCTLLPLPAALPPPADAHRPASQPARLPASAAFAGPGSTYPSTIASSRRLPTPACPPARMLTEASTPPSPTYPRSPPPPPFCQFVTSTPVTSLSQGTYCRCLRHLCLDWDVAFESVDMLQQCAALEVGARVLACSRRAAPALALAFRC